MDSGISTRHNVNLLERVLLDGNAQPIDVPLSLLEEITNYFSDYQQIGRGGFAVVYKGIVGKGMIAVKKLSRTFDLPEIKFHKEVECLMKAKHKNIVRFLGYCSETHGKIVDNKGKFVMADIREWLLCFEFVPKGNLDKYITDASHGLKWRERYKIIKGICEGLLHLHEKRILHLDLKPGNILLDDYMVPKIADFGLSRCLDNDQTRAITSNLCGSPGYFAPEFFRGEVTFTSDIYSLGVIIVEILIGEKRYPEDENVVGTWMNRLEGSDQWETQMEQVRVCIKIGLECMDLDPKKRPGARHIIDRLDNTTNAVETGINSSSIQHQVGFLKGQYCSEKIADVSSEYTAKDINKECSEMEELVEHVREDHWQQEQEEAPVDQWSLSWEPQYVKQNCNPQAASISIPNFGVLYRLKHLDIFGRKEREFYRKNGSLILQSLSHSRTESGIRVFKMSELKPVLKHENLNLKDGFGEIYKDIVDNVPITVRRLISETVGDNNDCLNEIRIQSQVIHKNIVRLRGCCLESRIPMLVYDFLSTDSLDDILHIKIKVPLKLGVRLSIAATSAGALAYAHSMASTKFLHGDLKPSNILFNGNFVPKIFGFGIRRMTGTGSHNIDDMSYMDPVYLETGLLTQKSDVYSFGVIILELLTRKKATHSDNNSLVRNFLENHKQGRKSTELFDKQIAITRDLVLLDNLAEIAAECLNLEAERRPEMREVAERLERLKKVKHLQDELAQHVRSSQISL